MSVELEYRVVDVFTDRPLAGNPVCVVLDPCPEALQQAVAREVNLSETTFPVVIGDRTYDVRIYTPHEEVPFAGHPSLGTAWVLGPGRWTQVSPGATIEIDADAGGASMGAPDPVITEVDAAAPVAALGLPGAEGAFLTDVGGIRHVIVPTDAALERLQPDLAAVAAASRAVGSHSLCPVRRLDDDTLHVRCFLPAAGIPEDPGTGSAAGPVALLARRRWGTNVDVTIVQGDELQRPCRIEVHAEEGAIRVGGRVAACASGRFTLSAGRTVG